MILDRIARYIFRITDLPFSGRNRTRIVLGTDRKKEVNTGYGDGGENNTESGAIDIVAAHTADDVNPNYESDKSRIYVSGKTDPDDYFAVDLGDSVEGKAAIVAKSDNVYVIAREDGSVKILKGDVTILMQGSDISIAAPDGVVKMQGANQAFIRGNDYADAENQFLDALNVFVQSISTTTPAPPNAALTVASVLAAAQVFQPQIQTFKNARNNYLSTKLKGE